MKKTSKTIVFFGNERLATGVTTDTPTLRALMQAGYNIAAVVSSFERGTSRSSRDLEIAKLAKKHGIPLLIPDKLSEVKNQLSSYHADAGVLVAYGKKVPQPIIDLFPHGIINIHPSLLPKYRGPTPIESAVLNGDTKTGVSMMSLVEDMDAGPVYAQSEIDLSGNETKQELADRLLDIGKEMLVNLLPDILSGKAAALPQASERATQTALISKKMGEIDWNKPAKVLGREIRAFAGWPKSRTTIGDIEAIITKAHVVEESGQPGKPAVIDHRTLIVYCSEQALKIELLKPAGKQEMSSQAFIAGYKDAL